VAGISAATVVATVVEIAVATVAEIAVATVVETRAWTAAATAVATVAATVVEARAWTAVEIVVDKRAAPPSTARAREAASAPQATAGNPAGAVECPPGAAGLPVAGGVPAAVVPAAEAGEGADLPGPTITVDRAVREHPRMEERTMLAHLGNEKRYSSDPWKVALFAAAMSLLVLPLAAAPKRGKTPGVRHPRCRSPGPGGRGEEERYRSHPEKSSGPRARI